VIDKIKILDTELFLFLNGKHNSFFDPIMYWASDNLFWIPFYLFLAYILIRQYKKDSIIIFLSIALLITLSDQISSHLIKNTLVLRLRPSHEPALQALIHLSKAGAGGKYGFVSSHTSNAFALVSFLYFLLTPNFNWLKWVLFFWAVLVSYSRIYNGVHYPADVLVATVLGILLGYLIFKLYSRYQLNKTIKT
jgi:undecaprenyl-diphosphatase